VTSSSEPVRILLVEDNPIDVRATLRAARELKISNSIDVVNDGDAAIQYFESGDHPVPDLVLLDLNLPGRDGHDVLAHIKQDDALKRIPVVILTTSANDADVLGAYDRGANAYVNKPIDLAGWQAVVSQIEGFWFSVVRLPPA
jgi:two-component system, chemotaxis family, response regulator Rcp1